MEDLRYPIGDFELKGEVTRKRIDGWIVEIESIPSRVRQAIEGLSEEQLDMPYRPDGWTVRQVVHHLPDSHLNSYMRFKLAMTEDTPAIRPYEEARWAELSEAKSAPPEVSLALLDALHHRWVLFLRSLTDADFQREFFHPESKESVTLGTNVAIYAWHGNHHIAHITALRNRMGW